MLQAQLPIFYMTDPFSLLDDAVVVFFVNYLPQKILYKAPATFYIWETLYNMYLAV